MPNKLEIDHSEIFDNLEHAPIVEAVVSWHATATTNFFETDFTSKLSETFPDYESRQQNSLTADVSGTEGGLAIDHKNVVQGARLIQNKSDTLNFACKFLRNGVIFSKLAPYKDWVSFTEAVSYTHLTLPTIYSV